MGAKKFGTSFEAQGNQTFWRDIPEFCRDIPGVPEKFEKKGLCSILVPYYKIVGCLCKKKGVATQVALKKASCGETVVQKGVFGESVSSLPP